MKLRTFLLLGLSHAAALVTFGNVTLAPLFRDSAVLQRDMPLPIWGRADANEAVTVAFHGQKLATTAAADGRWKVVLAPEKAASEPGELLVTGKNTVTVRDVVVGDVWLCSGQSNMEFRLSQAMEAEKEIAEANYPLIRTFKIPHLVAETPQADCPGAWKSASPTTAGTFTAVGFFFARDLYQRLHVPIGLIDSSWGGTFIEAWTSLPALKTDPAYELIEQRWQTLLKEYPAKVTAHEAALAKWKEDSTAAQAAGKKFTRRQPIAPEGPGSRWLPAGMYHAMIAPLEPAALRGVLWYQGEANGARAGEYRTLFPGMIKQWRQDFQQPELPFYFVQLANFERGVDKTNTEWAFLREAQRQALALPKTGMAVTIDIGNPKNIHPTNKQEVGRRLALWARTQLFGEKVEYSGPEFVSAKSDGATLKVTLNHAEGATLRDSATNAFEVAGEDRVFAPATARLDGTSLVLTSPQVSHPIAARYAWKNSPTAPLFNAANLPASPFRTDDWDR